MEVMELEEAEIKFRESLNFYCYSNNNNNNNNLYLHYSGRGKRKEEKKQNIENKIMEDL